MPGELLFVDSKDPKSKTDVRKHIARLVRDRRRHESAKHSDAPRRNSASSAVMSPSQRLRADVEHDLHGDSQLSKTQRIIRALDASPRDPFDSLAIPVSPQDSAYLRYYVSDMSIAEFGTQASSALVPSKDLAFRSAMESPSALHTIIAIAAVHRANVDGVEHPDLVEKHLIQSMELLRKGLLTINESNWQYLVQPLFELVACDELRGRYDSLRVHVQALKRLLMTFGGITQLSHLPRLQILTCYIFHGAGVSYISDSQEIVQHASILCRLMNSLGVVAYLPYYRDMLKRYFGPNTPLCRLLCSSSEHYDIFEGFGVRGYHRVAALLMIAQEVTELIANLDGLGLELYLERLYALYTPNVRLFKFILTQGGLAQRFEEPVKNWRVVQMMQIYKLLDDVHRRRLHQTLIAFLGGAVTTDVWVEEDVVVCAEANLAHGATRVVY